MKTIRQRQLQFLGQICRHKGLEYFAITEKIEGKRNRGRQRITLIERLNSRAIGKGSNNNFMRLTENRFERRTWSPMSVTDRGPKEEGADRNKNERCLANIVFFACSHDHQVRITTFAKLNIFFSTIDLVRSARADHGKPF
ncbi:hypothetical protein PoB_006734500 [Plakobranchus ocellatus]|uniref:Uncharacterized protein n=1 Tax=Plakobranchus ocellatus TaxID=259542 RepID=A0AAV4D9P1_9GAST|nr:hypothetical protein PoB_006734500 [Plakobranchus ocellatus]